MYEFDLIVEKIEKIIKEKPTDKELKEIWTVPVGLKPIVKIDNKIFYGSKKLTEIYINAMSKQPKTKAIIDKINTLVKRKKINIAFMNRSIFKFVMWRLFAEEFEKKTLGFYDPEVNIICILLDNNINKFGVTADNFMADLTIHELIHMVGTEKSSKFISTFEKELISYYKSYFKMLFSLNDKCPDKIIEEVVNFIYTTFERKRMAGNSSLVKYYQLSEKLFKPFTTLTESEFTLQLIDFITLIKLYFRNPTVFFSNIRKYRHIISPMYHSYNKVFSIRSNFLCIQELYLPSEVIAIWSSKGPISKFHAAIKAL